MLDEHTPVPPADNTETPTLAADVRTTPDGTIVVLAGELDAATADTFRDALRRAVAAPGTLGVDMSEVTFVDSTGLRALVEAQRSAGDGRPIRIVGASRAAAKLLAVTRLDQVFAREPTVDPSAGLDAARDSVVAGVDDARAALEAAVDRNDDALRSGRNPQFGRGALDVLRRRTDEARHAVVLFGEATGTSVSSN